MKYRTHACVPILQPELRRVLYPVFIHSFLELVERGAPGESSQMMMRYKRRFAEHSKTRAQVCTSAFSHRGTGLGT